MKGQRKQFDWMAMQAFIDSGAGYVHCHRQFGIAHATWIRAITRGQLRVETERRPYADQRKRFDWSEIQAFYDTGVTMRDCRARFGFSNASWTKAVRRGELKPRSWGFTTEEALAQSKCRLTIKRHLLRAGILKNRCDWCGLTSWRGLPISIQIDHINGVRDDHRLENLRMLCPNCHSQTATFAARNIRSNA